MSASISLDSYDASCDGISNLVAMIWERSVDLELKRFLSFLHKGPKIMTFTWEPQNPNTIIEIQYDKDNEPYRVPIYMNKKNDVEEFQSYIKMETGDQNEALIKSVRLEFNNGSIINSQTEYYPKGNGVYSSWDYYAGVYVDIAY